MKVGDMVRLRTFVMDCRRGSPWDGDGVGLLVEQCGEHIQWMNASSDTETWTVLWSKAGKVMRHRDCELRLVEAFNVAPCKASHAAKNKKRSANQ